MADMRPDLLADLRELSYPDGGVTEVRLHHVFEHFDRATALRLLIEWRGWLRAGGTLRIETPDFGRSAAAYLLARVMPGRVVRGPLGRLVGHGTGSQLRHIFGSHEADWAVHWDGWDRPRYRHTLGALGFEELRFRAASWRGIHSLEVIALASDTLPPREKLEEAAERLLRDSLVDESASELRQLENWMAVVRRRPAGV